MNVSAAAALLRGLPLFGAQITNQSRQATSLSDPLTGLRNRRFVFEEVSRDLEVVRRKYADEESGVDSKGEIVTNRVGLVSYSCGRIGTARS